MPSGIINFYLHSTIDTIDYVTGIGNLQFIAYDDNFAGSARVTFGARVAIDTNKAYVVSNILLRCCVGLRAPFFLGGDSPRRVPVCFERRNTTATPPFPTRRRLMSCRYVYSKLWGWGWSRWAICGL